MIKTRLITTQQWYVIVLIILSILFQKGCGYHLDLFVLAILIEICSVMGLPWFVAATVLSINHVNSLKLESECAAPGEKPQFLGVREQRATHILIFLMIGCSVLLTPMLRNIPMPVLFGVFLYMGVASLKGLQFFDRILIMLMPVKYQPDYMFLRQVRANGFLNNFEEFLFYFRIFFKIKYFKSCFKNSTHTQTRYYSWVVTFPIFWNKCAFLGTVETCTHVHCNPACLSRLLVDHKILQFYLDSVSLNGK